MNQAETGPTSASGSRVVSVSRHIPAPAEVIFDLLADPRRHPEIDGSGTVRGAVDSAPDRLGLGSRFGMNMKLGIPYRIANEVIEFEENRRIAWRHFGHHIWRYELEPDGDGTLVTESFDWSRSRFPPFYTWVRYPARHRVAMTATLERLGQLLAGSS